MFKQINRWVNKIALRGLENAYQGANTIKAIENKHFNGEIISLDSDKGKTVSEYFQTQLDQQLIKIRLGLTQFKVTSFFSNPESLEKPTDGQITVSVQSQILAKLDFIESVLGKYRDRQDLDEIIDAKIIPDKGNKNLSIHQANKASKEANDILLAKSEVEKLKFNDSRSFFNPFNQIRKEFSPEYEQEVIREFRKLRRQERVAIRWLVILLIVPVLVQIATKTFVFQPWLDNYRDQHPVSISNTTQLSEVSEKYLEEFNYWKEALEVGELVGVVSEEEKKEKLKEIANDLYREGNYQSVNGLKNVLADACSIIAFIILVIIARPKLIFLRDWFNRSFKGLNDVTKVFIFILVTDLFVGFHSVEGWDVILGRVADHFGLPENREYINLFIATVPVIMDSCFKLWVFNYLTRSSPSSVAILEKMNQ